MWSTVSPHLPSYQPFELPDTVEGPLKTEDFQLLKCLSALKCSNQISNPSPTQTQLPPNYPDTLYLHSSVGEQSELFPKLFLTGSSSLSHQPRVGKKSVVLARGVLGDRSQHLFFHFRTGLRLLQESPQLLVTAVGYRGLLELPSHPGKLWIGEEIPSVLLSGRGRRS